MSSQPRMAKPTPSSGESQNADLAPAASLMAVSIAVGVRAPVAGKQPLFDTVAPPPKAPVERWEPRPVATPEPRAGHRWNLIERRKANLGPPNGIERRRKANSDRRQGEANLFGYWNRLRGDRRFPAWSDLDPEQIATYWPSSVLLEARGGADKLKLEQAFAVSLRVAKQRCGTTYEGPFELTSMMTEWLISASRRVVLSGLPVEEEDSMPVTQGIQRFRLLALPMSDREAEVEHVLCNLIRC